MRTLETQPGSRLFDRTTRSVSVTPAGKKLLPIASAAVDGLEQVAEQIGKMSDKARYTLRVAATPLVSFHLLPAVLHDIRERYPKVMVQLTSSLP